MGDPITHSDKAFGDLYGQLVNINIFFNVIVVCLMKCPFLHFDFFNIYICNKNSLYSLILC